MFHGERRRREAHIQVPLAQNSELRSRARAGVRGEAAAGAGVGAALQGPRVGRGSSVQQPHQAHAKPHAREVTASGGRGQLLQHGPQSR